MLEPILLQNIASLASGSIETWISYAPEAVLIGIGAGIYFVLRKRQSFAKEKQDAIEYEKIRMGYYSNQNQYPQQNSQQPPQPSQNNVQGNQMPQNPPPQQFEGNAIVSYFAMQKITELAKKRKMSQTQMLDEIVITYLTSQNPRNAPRQPPQQGGGVKQNAFAGLDKMSNDLLSGKSTII